MSRIKYIQQLKKSYDGLKKGKESLLEKIDEVELAEQVYNSNAIENSTLTLAETEKILLEQSVRREISVRELYEAQNLSNVVTYLNKRSNQKVDLDLMLLLHRFLIGGIKDSIAGRLRKDGEFVRIANHIAPAPDQVEELLTAALDRYNQEVDLNFIEKIALFHLEFERIHPFCDGNGRIGRVLINQQLANLGLPPVIIRNKGKRDYYYPVFEKYQHTQDHRHAEMMTNLLELSVLESLHKRLAYLTSKNITKITEYAESNGLDISNTLAKARRQTIPAFRDKGVWKIGT
jgi:Fic family protein